MPLKTGHALIRMTTDGRLGANER